MAGLWLGERGVGGEAKEATEKEREGVTRGFACPSSPHSSPGHSSLSFLLILPLVILIYRVFPCYSELLFIHSVGSPI